MRDLWILVADVDTEATLRTLLTDRQAALGIRSVEFTITRHLQRDPGCRLAAASTARSYLNDHNYALVLFDKHGSGDEGSDRQQIQNAVEGDLHQNGWENRSKAIVIEPELEAWVWSASANVGKVLGWNEGTGALREWLRERGLWPEGDAKPPDPKFALKRAMRVKNRAPTVTTFTSLAQKAGFQGCQDSAFREMRETLQRWFPSSHGKT